MSSQFAASLPAEQPAIAEFLRGTFHAGDDAVSFRSDVLRWKYFSEHPDWPGDRSYLVKKDGQIVAHGGVWPVRLAKSGQCFTCVHLIDWAANRSAPGAGLWLLRKLASLSDVLLTIGGSDDTRAILTKIGYRQVGELKRQARVVRPWSQFRSVRERNWKDLIKLGRNAIASVTSRHRSPGDWHATRISQFDSSHESVLESAGMDGSGACRTSGGLNRMLACPAAQFSAFALHRSQRLCGYFLLAQIGKQVRVVDLHIDDNGRAAWLKACSVAAQTAEALPEAAEIATGFSTNQICGSFAELRFRSRGSLPIYCYDPKKVLGSGTALDLSLLDGDLCFIGNVQNPFWT